MLARPWAMVAQTAQKAEEDVKSACSLELPFRECLNGKRRLDELNSLLEHFGYDRGPVV